MTRDDQHPQPDRLIDLVTRAHDARVSAREEAPGRRADEMDPNDIAALAAGAPAPTVRGALERQAARGSAADRRTVATVAAAAPAQSQAPTAEARRFWWLPLSAAALVLAALGAAWFLNQGPTSPGAPQAFGDTQLAQAFDTLRARAPESLGTLQPLLAAERSEVSRVIRRGGLAVRAPVGAYLRAPDRLVWDALDGARGYQVQVISDDGDALIETTHDQASMPWPTDVEVTPGTAYVVAVSTIVGGVRVRGNATFSVLSVADAETFAQARAQIQTIEPAALRPVLLAHTALRMGLVRQAGNALDDISAGSPAAQLIDETRAFIRKTYALPSQSAPTRSDR